MLHTLIDIALITALIFFLIVVACLAATVVVGFVRALRR